MRRDEPQEAMFSDLSPLGGRGVRALSTRIPHPYSDWDGALSHGAPARLPGGES